MALRWFLSAAIFAFAFIVNPVYLVGCGASDEPSPAQRARAEAELKAHLDIIDGTPSWTFTQGGEDYELFLALAHAKTPTEQARRSAERASFGVVAYACGSYTLYNRAAACSTSFSLPLEGTLTVRRLSDDAVVVQDLAVTGQLSSLGYHALLELGGGGDLSLQFDYEGAYELIRFQASMLGTARIDFAYSGS